MDAVEFPSHRHPLNRRESLLGLLEKESRVCGLCGKEVIDGPAYECSQCNFTAHCDCAKNPPSLVIDKSKIHEHTLTLLPTHVSFTCNACGLTGNKSPYVCLKCSFMVHKDCAFLPGVININRHDHRLFHTCFLGHDDIIRICGVCRRMIDGTYGAYYCAICSDAFHTRCAIRIEVWDGTNLEDVVEDDPDINKVIRNGTNLEDVVEDDPHINKVIRHFSHEHPLGLEDQGTSDVVCSVCAHPIAFETFYRCQLCNFFLHERCAYLPRRKYMFLHVHPVTLCADHERSGSNGLSRCEACDLHFTGFRYLCLKCKDDPIEFDVRCSSVSEPFVYDLHPGHPLFLLPPTNEAKICNVCKHYTPKYVLSCITCDFNLCFACATLPKKAIYKYDEHLLSHTIGEDDTANPYWCDICENKIEEMRSHYSCTDCGPVLHTECVLGSFRNMRPGFSFITKDGHKYEVILHDRTSLLRCSQCHKDCHEPLLLMSTATTTDVTTYLCSSPCFETYVSV